ncbi:MAG TPA: acyl-CoA dehydrogenase family protein [Candidatus Dormibacteraeota bacterium]
MTREELLARADALVAVLRERAAYAEELRRVPEDTIRDFQEAGLFKAMQPARWGGHEVEPGAFYEAVVRIASGCVSSGWVLSVVGVHAWHMALFPLEAQQEVWGKDTSTLVASSYAPIGKVTKVEGGFRVTGTWSFSSGCDYCDWVLTGCIVPDPERPERRQGYTLLLPRSDYKIIDNWQVLGLLGSGSKAFQVEDAFVPDHRSLSTRDVRKLDAPGLKANESPVYRMPQMNVFLYAVSTPAIGAARGMLDNFVEQGRKRVAAPNSPFSRDLHALKRIGLAANNLQAAESRLRSDFDEMLRRAEAGDSFPFEARARFRAGAAYCLGTSLEGIDALFEAAGGFSIQRDNPLQRIFRDSHAMRAHAANNVDRATETYGKVLLGLDDPEVII